MLHDERGPRGIGDDDRLANGYALDDGDAERFPAC
jgi:hypothetical protein